MAVIDIITTSCETEEDYFLNKDTAIYPAFVDNQPYESWIEGYFGSIVENARKFYFQFKATGAPSYVWTLESGSIPPGLSLDGNGQLSGIAKKEGVYTFTLRATSGVDFETKLFKIKVYPERSRWLRDARYGVTVSWGRFSDPVILNSFPNNGTTAFEDRTIAMKETYQGTNKVKWGDQWAQQFLQWGAGFIEFSAIGQDSYRNWPNGFLTWKNLHSNIDYLAPLVDAFHENGLKVLSYFPPDYHSNNPAMQDTNGVIKWDYDGYDDVNHNWGGMNLQLIEELVKVKKIDGLWIDIGGANDIYSLPRINPGWLNYEYLMPIIRYNNPFFIFGVNPGVRGSWDIELKFGGTQVQSPYADFVIYESTKDRSTNAIMGSEQAVPLLSKKKMAVYVSNKITTTWGWGSGMEDEPIKDSATIIENIARNWNAGATVAMGLPVYMDGTLLNSRYQPVMSAIGSYVTANKAFSVDPEISFSAGTLTITTPSPARIYYTLDGTEPSKDSSNIYVGPIQITRNTIVKARTLQQNKSIGFVKELQIESFAANNQTLLLPKEPTSDSTSFQETIGYYRGMQFTVGNAPVVVTAIGRRPIGSSVPRDVIIKRYYDEYPIYSGTLLASQPEEAGYQFTNIAEVRLEAGMTYVIAIQELANTVGIPDGDREKFTSNSFTDIPYTQNIRIVKQFNLSSRGDFYPFPSHNIGQVVNLKYRILANERRYDLALGKRVRFLNGVGGSSLIPAQYIRYAVNATDGDPNSYAIAGGDYAYTIQVDLLSLYKINRIAFRFTKYNFATEFEIYASIAGDSSDAVLLQRFANNRNLHFEYKFDPVLTRYVFVKSIKPNATGQEGGSMGFESISVYSDGL